jgi:hypothetical protein
MNWLINLSSALGMPLSGATVAVALYLASVGAENEANKDALRHIAHIIHDSGWSNASRPGAVIRRLFCLTFGETHLSWKCVRRSFYATLVVILSLSVQYCLATKTWPQLLWHNDDLIRQTIAILIAGFVADYLALWKTRAIFSFLDKFKTVIICVILDALSSILISILMMTIAEIMALSPLGLSLQDLKITFPPLRDMIGVFSHDLNYDDDVPLFAIVLLSTLMTSAWTVMILLSGTLLKILEPLRRLANWFCQVDEHPIRAIGFVAGLLVWVGSLIAALIAALISVHS